MLQYSIKDLENYSGIKSHTIRIWEIRHNTLVPTRTDTNIRRYSEDDLKKILNISLLNRNGHKISNIMTLTDDELRDEVFELYNRINRSDYYIDRLLNTMIEFNEDEFNKIFAEIIINFTLEEAVVKVIFPFLDRIGVMWQVNMVNPVQQKFITYLIRQKLIAAIDGQSFQVKDNAKTLALFLPYNEQNEISLLLHLYLIKRSGHNAVYLGQSVNPADMHTLSNIVEADFFMTSYKPLSEHTQNKFLKSFYTELPDAKLIMSACGGFKSDDYLNVKHLLNISDFKAFLQEL